MSLPELGELEYVIIKTCYHCKGSGEVPEYSTDETKPPTGTIVCPVCEGEGKLVDGEIWSVD